MSGNCNTGLNISADGTLYNGNISTGYNLTETTHLPQNYIAYIANVDTPRSIGETIEFDEFVNFGATGVTLTSDYLFTFVEPGYYTFDWYNGLWDTVMPFTFTITTGGVPIDYDMRSPSPVVIKMAANATLKIANEIDGATYWNRSCLVINKLG